jgi:hypothetical protein
MVFVNRPLLRALERWALVGIVCLLASPNARASWWGLFLDFGAPKDAAPLPDVRNDLLLLRDRFASFMGVPPGQIILPAAPRLRRDEAPARIRDFAGQVPKGANVLLYIRAYVTRPSAVPAMYFYTSEMSLAAPLTNGGPSPIRDAELASWLSAFDFVEQGDFAEQRGASDVLLLLDLRTMDASLGAYFGNRQMLGTWALSLISRKAPRRSMLAVLAGVLDESSDRDTDATVTLDEVATAFSEAVYNEGVTPDDAITALTGTPDTPLRVLPSALLVETRPQGATVLLDGRGIGQTPLRYSQLSRREYAVGVALDGYRTPPPKTVRVASTRGKGYHVVFGLEPVEVRGEVTAPPGARVGSVILVVPETDVSATLGGPGTFAMAPPVGALQPGKTYRILAVTPDDRFAGDAEFTFGGHEDIVRPVALRERTAWEVAAVRFQAGFRDEALASAEAARNADYAVPQLSEEFARFLIQAWRTQTDNPRAMIACAYLSLRLKDQKGSAAYWQLARSAAPKGSPDYEYAVRGLRTVRGDSLFYAVALALLALVLVSLLYAILRHRRTSAAGG